MRPRLHARREQHAAVGQAARRRLLVNPDAPGQKRLLAGCAAAVPGSLLAASLEMELLRKLFGAFLIAAGLVEIFCKGLKKNSA